MERARLVKGAPAFEEWKRANTEFGDDGILTFEGDILIRNEDQLRAIYLRRYADASYSEEVTVRAIVECFDDFDNTWPTHEKLDLTYCFGDFWTPGLEDVVREQMRLSTLVWERAADVNFVEVPMSKFDCNCISRHDGCTDYTERARIRVKQRIGCSNGTPFGTICSPANADKANTDPNELLIHAQAMDSEIKLDRIMVHELGHILGFDHEQFRFQQPGGGDGPFEEDCVTSEPWRAVTEPDSESIMGYGKCAGIAGIFNSPNIITSVDRKGAGYLYNLPRNEATSYTSESVDDILWIRPDQNRYELWRAIAQNSPGALVVFQNPIEFCAQQSPDEDNCQGDFRHAKPIPAALTDEHLTDVITYGAKSRSDSLLMHSATGPLLRFAASIDGATDLPLVGRFFGGENTEDVWWINPGEDLDPLGELSMGYSVPADADFGSGGGSDSHDIPIVGLWAERGSATPNSQIIWYNEREQQFRLAFKPIGLTGMQEEILSPVCLFFENVRQPIALRGDFDGDGRMEVFWVSLSNGQHVIWRDTWSMWDPGVNNACGTPEVADVLQTNGVDLNFAKPFVGDFDGDDSDDIYWYTSDESPDQIWLQIGAPNGPAIMQPIVDGLVDPQIGDRTPFVGDYNGDLCADILWFSPDREYSRFVEDPTTGAESYNEVEPEAGDSLLWRSMCGGTMAGFQGFSEQVVVPPRGAYPVGYDPRGANRRADL